MFKKVAPYMGEYKKYTFRAVMMMCIGIVEQNGVALEVTPYFLINVSGEGEGFSMWSPTPCDVLATDWVEVHD